MKAHEPAILSGLLRLALLACVCVGTAGCSLFDGDSDRSDSLREVCEDAFNRFVTQHPNGLGVTSEQCVASERGQWIEGRCYCHGRNE